ncbi:MAG TPA: serine/threonine-protein kinase, partial [Thermoanaerobaculia bacterium]|nr:serine/threonine-protein kinase [Thermoanaerobaculia bacterium]
MKIEAELATWAFEEGEEIAPGRRALRLLGGGFRYEAYLATDEEMLALVVAKILRPDSVSDAGALAGLGAESGALRGLDHPVLPRCFDAVLHGSRPHLLLEFVEGPRLSTLLRKYGILAYEQAIPLATQLCSVLHYMARRGMVHLDVKPRNIIMSGPPRLIDLSVARGIHEAERLDTQVGTDAYMAPEQCTPSPGRVGPAADVWGLGVTLYESLVGEPAFPRGSEEDGASAGKRFPQLTHRPAPMPSRVPSELAGAVDAALAYEPEDRPTAREMAEAVEPLLRRPRRLVLNRLKP